ncbi:MAG: flagellar basal body rod protein FlgG, partial [Alphaproteobacteria bacterium]|nr:flagellar basal body rod protein FlgG [Alphaproteobacteria bacterium]
PAAGAFGSLVQGFLETSNVNPIQEIANLIKAQRAYELNAKVIETAEAMASTTTTA